MDMNTLALVLSIIALTFSIVTYNQGTMLAEYQNEITELKEKLDKLKAETAERVSKIRQETANAIKKIGIEINKKYEISEPSESQ